MLPNTYNLVLITCYLLPNAFYPNLLPITFFWTLVVINVILASIYIMLTTDYIFQMLYTGKYIPYFMIRIKLPDICCSYFKDM